MEKTIIIFACVFLVISTPFFDINLSENVKKHNSNFIINIINNINFLDKNHIQNCK
jgi:hypothetical protein